MLDLYPPPSLLYYGDGGQGLPQTPRGCLAILVTGLDDVLFERTAYSGHFSGANF